MKRNETDEGRTETASEYTAEETSRDKGKPYLWLRYAGFPLILLPVLAGLWMESIALTYGGLIVSIFLGAFMERLIPFHGAWNMSNLRNQDWFYSGLTLLLGPSVGFCWSWLMGPGNLLERPRTEWLTDTSPMIQILPALALSGLLPYLYHRISHQTAGVLWKIHSIHHAPGNVYLWNALRLHPLNTLINTTLGLLPLLLLGFHEYVIFAAGTLNNFMAIAHHLNVDFRHGFLNWILNTGELHRWHHRNDLREGNSNYSGGFLILWDLLFGTRYLPVRRMGRTEAGLVDSEHPYHSVPAQLVYPFASRQFRCCSA